jgi:hypothetical protein
MSGRLNRYPAKAIVFLITVALVAGMAGCTYNPPPSQNLEIRTWYDLDDVRNNLRGHHILMNDLDSTTPGYTELASAAANGGKGWQPIGNLTAGANYTFSGTFDGQEYEIRDLFINRPDETRVGLFCFVYEGGVIKNLGVMNVTMICQGMSGGLVGQNGGGDESNRYAGTISNSYFSGNVTGEWYVGGLVGINFGTVNNCYATCDVTGSGYYVGGLVGLNWGGNVSKCYSTGSATGTGCVGGLVGQNGLVDESNSRYAGTVGDSYSTASVTGETGVGGLVGGNYDGVVSDSYSTGSVTGNSSVGGLVGINWEGTGTVNNSFWDTQTSGQSTSAGGTGKNTTEMQDIATFSGTGWDITAVALNETNLAYIWNIVNNVTYPFLSWQPA